MLLQATEMQQALDAKLYTLALTCALLIPDICSAIEHGDTTRPRYEAWFNKYVKTEDLESFTSTTPASIDLVGVPSQPPRLTARDCYLMRCGHVHEGRMIQKTPRRNDPPRAYDRIVVGLPGAAVFHETLVTVGLESGDEIKFLHLDIRFLCLRMVEGLEDWLQEKSGDAAVQQALSETLQLRPNGISPHFEGQPVIC